MKSTSERIRERANVEINSGIRLSPSGEASWTIPIRHYMELKQLALLAADLVETLERLSKVGPPSIPTNGPEWAEVCLMDNCKIASEALAKAKACVGEGE